MIVKDEEEMLPAFLGATRGLYDELCVVDTGSSDNTLGILKQQHVRLGRRPWDDDFAAARNASLDLATGEWILFLDADERPDAASVAAIRAVIEDESVGAASLWFDNLLPGGQRNEMPLLRLFRADPAIRFRHRIHEDITAAVEAFLSRKDLRHTTLEGR
ncbi:MAG: glycosyltransferase, partial [Myxococcota bacterium]